MVLAQLAQARATNWDASGTAGTAADLAKTNLVSAASLPRVDERVAGCPEVNFSVLSGFDFGLTKDIADKTGVDGRIPAEVRALDGRRVVIQGFLLPVRMDEGLAVEFLLMRTQSMCCYGVAPKINEWISVRLTGKGVKAVMDRPIAVAGTLHVGPQREHGLLMDIYRLDADKVIGAE